MYWAVGVWSVIFALSLIYSAKFSYRDAFGRPVMFQQVILVLRLAEFLLLVVVFIFAFRRSAYLICGVALIMSFLFPRLVRRHAYNTELRRKANLQVEGNRMEWEQALEVAKTFLDREIRDGQRSG